MKASEFMAVREPPPAPVMYPRVVSVKDFCEEVMSTYSGPVNDELTVVRGEKGQCDFQSQPVRVDRQFANVKLECESLDFRNMGFKGRLILAGRRFQFEKCAFYDDDRGHPMVEVVGEAWVKFVNCEFRSASKCAIAAGNKTRIVCTECLFLQNANCIIVRGEAGVNFDRCLFQETRRLSVYSYQGGSAWCRDCEFRNCDGKAVVAIKCGRVAASRCTFDGMESGALVVSEHSRGMAENCQFRNVRCAGVMGIRDSEIYVYGCQFETLHGNAIQFQNATGIVHNVAVNECQYPAIVVTGQSSNPVIMGSRIANAAVGVSSRDFAVPIIDSVEFDGIRRDAFSVSDFSRPVIRNCSFWNVRDMHYRVFNGAQAYVEGDTQKCAVFHEGKLIGQYNGPLIPEQEESVPNVLNSDDVPFDPFPVPPKMGVHKIPLIQLPDDASCPSDNVGSPRCVNCGQETDHILSSCGHRICARCVDQARQNGVCPLCNTAFQEATQVHEQGRCCVCFENPATNIMMPCGHKCLCTTCALNILRPELSRCPTCSAKLKGYKIDFTYQIGTWPFPVGTSFASEQ